MNHGLPHLLIKMLEKSAILFEYACPVRSDISNGVIAILPVPRCFAGSLLKVSSWSRGRRRRLPRGLQNHRRSNFNKSIVRACRELEGRGNLYENFLSLEGRGLR